MGRATHSAGATRRPIRSFVLRQGRIVAGAARAPAMSSCPVYGMHVPRRRSISSSLFGRTAPKVLEIGFGMGETTAAIAAAWPQVDFLAVDVHLPGVGALLRGIVASELTNVRVLHHDAVDVVTTMIAPSSLSGILVLFPYRGPRSRP